MRALENAFVLACLATLLSAAVARSQPQAGDVFFQADFDAADALRSWQGADQTGVERVAGLHDTPSLQIDRPGAEGRGYRHVRIPLPLEKLRGTRVRVEAMVRANDVVQPPNPWNGVKCMLHTVGPAGPRWMQQNNVFGTFDWKPVQFIGEVPAETTEAYLVLGLENTTGRVCFDQVRMTIVAARRRAPEQPPTGPVFKGHDLPRLRGAMIGQNVSADDLQVLGGRWGANHVRWQLIWGGFPHSPADSADVAAYRRWLESALARLDQLLPVCRRLGIQVAIDVHTPPGGRNQRSECRMFHQREFQEAFVDIWQQLATRYRNEPAVWGYDLVNEPVEGVVAEGLMNWRQLAEHTAKRVRQIDPHHAIIVEPAPWGSPPSLEFFQPLDVPGIVYSVHMYVPHQFTHQGVYDNPVGIHYPGVVNGKHFGKAELEQALMPAIRYQRDYNVHIYLGEFSAIRWAPGDSALNYLRDVIDVCEQHQWDWAYHAFREWDGWSVEHGPERQDRQPTATPTPRQRLLQSWYGKNARAAAAD